MPTQKDLLLLLNALSKQKNTNAPQADSQKQIDDLVRNLSPSDAQKLQAVLQDPEAANRLLSTPQAQQLIKKFMGG